MRRSIFITALSRGKIINARVQINLSAGAIFTFASNGITIVPGTKIRQVSDEIDSLELQKFTSSWATVAVLASTDFTINDSNSYRIINNSDDAVIEYLLP